MRVAFYFLLFAIVCSSGCLFAAGRMTGGKGHIGGGLRIPIDPPETDSIVTPRGSLKKDATQEDVRQLLGVALTTSASDFGEIWLYDFGDQKKWYFYFIDGKLVEVKEEPQSVSAAENNLPHLLSQDQAIQRARDYLHSIDSLKNKEYSVLGAVFEENQRIWRISFKNGAAVSEEGFDVLISDQTGEVVSQNPGT